MHNLWLFLPDDAAQRQHRLWIGKRRRILASTVAENPRHALQRAADTIDAHPLISLEFGLPPMQQRGYRYLVSARREFHTEGAGMYRASANNGRVEL